MSTPSQVEAIFFAALEKQTAERAAYLDHACGDDPELRRRVERLLEAHPQAADFLARPAAVGRLGVDPHDNGDSRAANPPLSQIGDYRILREIGRGGMGVVYEAEQVSLGRRVALKVLPGPMSGDRMVQERFRREARAAARLHHTNIVPVYEVGQDGEVRFYAMQFIQGQGLDRVIAEMRRLRDRVGSEPEIWTAFEGPSPQPRGGPPPGHRGHATRRRRRGRVQPGLAVHPHRSFRPWRPLRGAGRSLNIELARAPPEASRHRPGPRQKVERPDPTPY